MKEEIAQLEKEVMDLHLTLSKTQENLEVCTKALEELLQEDISEEEVVKALESIKNRKEAIEQEISDILNHEAFQRN